MDCFFYKNTFLSLILINFLNLEFFFLKISPLDILPEQASVVVAEAGTAAAPSDFEQPTYRATSLLASYLDPSENFNHVTIKNFFPVMLYVQKKICNLNTGYYFFISLQFSDLKTFLTYCFSFLRNTSSFFITILKLLARVTR